MSERLTPQRVPLTCADVIRSGWLRRARNAIVADGYQIRAGERLVVEAKVLGCDNEWRPIMLSNGGRHFSSADELAKVLVYLQGDLPIPEPEPEHKSP